MAEDVAAQHEPIVSRDRAINAFRSVLRTAIVGERRFTVAELSVQCGVPARAIQSYMANDALQVREPSASAMLSILLVLGERAVNSVLAPIGYGGATALEEGDAMPPMQVVADGMQHLAVIAGAAADGRFDHTERPAVQKAADALIATVLPLSSIKGAA